MKRTWILVGLVAVVLAIAVALMLPRGTAPAPGPPATTATNAPAVVRVGAIVFLTGPQAALGTEVQGALDLLVEEVNGSGGINGRQLQIRYEDSRDQPKDAITAFRRFADENLPVLISTGDVVSLNLASFAEESRIPLVATVAAGPEIARPNSVFRVWIQATRQGERMAEHAAVALKLKRVAVLRINNEFGEASAGAFTKTFTGRSGTVTATETFGVADREVRNQIVKLRGTKPEGIFVTGFGDGYGAAIKQIRESGFRGQLMTDATLSIPFFRGQTSPANEGAYLATTPYDETSTEPRAMHFTQRWRAKYKSEPSFVGAFAYDALGMVVSVMKQGATTRAQVGQALSAMKSYDGAIGPLRFTAGSDLDFPIVIKHIEKGRQVRVSQ